MRVSFHHITSFVFDFVVVLNNFCFIGSGKNVQLISTHIPLHGLQLDDIVAYYVAFFETFRGDRLDWHNYLCENILYRKFIAEIAVWMVATCETKRKLKAINFFFYVGKFPCSFPTRSQWTEPHETKIRCKRNISRVRALLYSTLDRMAKIIIKFVIRRFHSQPKQISIILY